MPVFYFNIPVPNLAKRGMGREKTHSLTIPPSVMTMSLRLSSQFSHQNDPGHHQKSACQMIPSASAVATGR